MSQIKKAIILAAGLGTRFLPYSRVLPKEFFPLGDRPLIEYIVEEAYLSGIEEIVFVLNPDRQHIVSYFQDDKTIEARVKSKNNKKMLDDHCRLRRILKKISFSYVYQDNPIGDGDAILKAKNLVRGEKAVAVLFCDDIIYSKKEPGLKQLIKVFQKYKSPIIGLSKVENEKISSYGIVKAKKIGKRTYLIDKICEKPKIEEAPSNLAIVGKYIITPDVFDYIQKIEEDSNNEIRLSIAFQNMIKNGKQVLGYEFDGKWLECGTKEDWLKSNLFMTQKIIK